MGVSFFNQYMYYNDVTISLFGDDDKLDPEYVISKINKHTIPPKDSGAHLVSLSITPPKVNNQTRNDSGVRNNFGASGTVTVVDYKNSLFSRLVNHINQYNKDKSISFTPKIKITVKCYTGIEVYKGFIKDYKFSFNGGAPTISMDWDAIEGFKGKSSAIQPFGVYYNIGNFFKMAKEVFCKDDKFFITPVFVDDKRYVGGDAIASSGKLRFIQDSNEATPRPCADFDLRSLGDLSQENMLLNSYIWFTKNAVTNNENGDAQDQDADSSDADEKKKKNERKSLIGYLSKENPKEYIIEVKKTDGSDESTKSESTEACSELVFVQNGKTAPYKRIKINIDNSEQNRIVIPMTSISFETNLANINVQCDILNGFNADVEVTNGEVSTAANGSKAKVVQSAQESSDSKSNSSTEITFDCYNVMSFDLNNTATKVAFIVYDEYGEIHPISGTGFVQEVSYDLSGAVVKANVKVSKVLSSSDVTFVDSDPLVSEDDQDNNSNK